MSWTDLHKAIEKLNAHGYLMINYPVIHQEPFDSIAWRQRLDLLLATLTPIDDQPGALRYHLSGKTIERFLAPWLTCPILEDLGHAMFGSDQMQVNYIRYREPLYGRGLQRLHRDWDNKYSQRRLEVFIAFDPVTPANGCTEIIDLTTGNPVLITLDPGCVLLLDSSILHRGTRNRSGERRRVISFQVGPRGGADSTFACIFPIEPD